METSVSAMRTEHDIPQRMVALLRSACAGLSTGACLTCGAEPGCNIDCKGCMWISDAEKLLSEVAASVESLFAGAPTLLRQRNDLLEAHRQIAACEGPFKDGLMTQAQSMIQSMKSIARLAIARATA